MVALAALWVWVMVYPNPRPFVASVQRLFHPPVDPEAAREVAASLPDDYVAVENFVREKVPWKPAWDLYGLPWYFPTVSEVMRDWAGDCQAQAVLIASVLRAKNMPFTFRYSFDHVWVDYPGKQVTALEDPSTAFASNEGKGWLTRLPEKFPLLTILKQRVAYHWTPMPSSRKLLILLGVSVIFVYGERRGLGRMAYGFKYLFGRLPGKLTTMQTRFCRSLRILGSLLRLLPR
ncbi:MAG: transglutaminase-like domain-containing protein [Thermoleophilia bacterium]|nr:transglutaminase-like domain-containing protein [Thermoleophilia bacterium]